MDEIHESYLTYLRLSYMTKMIEMANGPASRTSDAALVKALREASIPKWAESPGTKTQKQVRTSTSIGAPRICGTIGDGECKPILSLDD